VVIGEGERDEAPMLYIGEKVGGGGPKIDIALDPLEGTTITAKGLPNALAVMAMAEHGGFLNAPDVYMDKIAVGGGLPEGIVDLDKTPKQNLSDLAKAKKIDVADLVVCILGPAAPFRAYRQGARGGRAHHADRRTGRRVGRDRHVDRRFGPSTSTWARAARRRASLAAAALRAIGGQIQGRLLFRNDDEKARARKWGITDLNRKYSMNRHGQGRRDVRGDRRDLGLDA